MRLEPEIRAVLPDLCRRHDVLVRYRDECARIADHHGVQDAASDLRELLAVLTALKWVLGEHDHLGY